MVENLFEVDVKRERIRKGYFILVYWFLFIVDCFGYCELGFWILDYFD